MVNNYFDAETRKRMNVALRETVDAASVGMYQSHAPREHLGASIIGEDCAAKIWFGFRWAKHGTFDGRMYRLFQTGHIYEHRFVEWYRAAGFEVFPFDEKTNEQWRITACNGHFGGSLDSGAIYRGVNLQALANIVGGQQAQSLANALEPLRNLTVVLEFKTHNEKQFAKLQKHGVRISHPKHFKQFSTYGTFYQLPVSIYAGYCKNNDEFLPEVHNNDYQLAADMVRKADEIIAAQIRPARIAEDQTYFECKICTYLGICHNGEAMAKSCRSCRHASAVENKQWYCSYHNGIIPAHIIPAGCDYWAQIG